MRADDIVAALLEAEVPLPDAKTARRQLRKMFTPGSRWQRVNYRFPTKLLDHDRPAFATKLIPAGQPVMVTVVKPIVDAIVFQLPDGQSSYLTYPDQEQIKAYLVYPTGVELIDSRGTILSYRPV